MWTWFGKTGVGAEVGNWGPAGWQKKLGGDGIGEAGQRRLYGGRRHFLRLQLLIHAMIPKEFMPEVQYYLKARGGK